MTNQLVNQFVAKFSTDQLVGFIVVLARVSPLFVFAPLFSSTMLPSRVRTIAALGLSIGLTPIALHGVHLPSGPAAIAGLVGESLLVGYAFAFSIGVLFAAVQAAGMLLDASAGFSFGAEIDPTTGVQSAVLAQLYAMFGTMIFLMIGGDAWVVRGLGRTFTLVPIDGNAKLAPIMTMAENAAGSLLLSAVEVAAPVLLAVLITDVAFGVVSRVVPQLNVFAVGFPMKIAVALLTTVATLPFVGSWIAGQLSISVGAALNALQVT